jgi:hypothetical protein
VGNSNGFDDAACRIGDRLCKRWAVSNMGRTPIAGRADTNIKVVDKFVTISIGEAARRGDPKVRQKVMHMG